MIMMTILTMISARQIKQRRLSARLIKSEGTTHAPAAAVKNTKNAAVGNLSLECISRYYLVL